MACIRKRRGKWVVDYRDAAGIRRWATCKTRRLAEAVLAERLDESRQPREPAVDPDIRLGDYGNRWLDLIAAIVKPRTLEGYRQLLRLHLIPQFGSTKVRLLHKGQIKVALAMKLNSGLAQNSVRLILAVLRALLNAAVDDGIILANPAEKLGRSLRLIANAKAHQEEIKAMTREQVSEFLRAARTTTDAYVRRYSVLFLLLARTGMRLGEALAVQWDDADFKQRKVRVARAFSRGRVEKPKSGHGRTVDMSEYLANSLLRLQVQRKTESLMHGWAELPKWVFCTEAGTPLDESRVRKVFSKVLKLADLPPHFSPHCLRHTFASLLLQHGESPQYVQELLGHRSITLTADLYGRWLPKKPIRGGVNRLDDPSGSKVVAKTESATSDVLEVADSIGGPSRTRTLDPLIKSQLLYQLS